MFAVAVPYCRHLRTFESRLTLKNIFCRRFLPQILWARAHHTSSTPTPTTTRMAEAYLLYRGLSFYQVQRRMRIMIMDSLAANNKNVAKHQQTRVFEIENDLSFFNFAFHSGYYIQVCSRVSRTPTSLTADFSLQDSYTMHPPAPPSPPVYLSYSRPRQTTQPCSAPGDTS